MQPTTSEPVDQVLLRALGDEVIRMTSRRSASPTGAVLDASAFRILRVLEEHGPQTLQELAARLQLDRSTVTRQVDAAQRGGHVERPAARGRTARAVRPTDRGREALLHDGRLRGSLYAQAVAALGEDRVGDMVESLRLFNDALDRATTADRGSGRVRSG